MNAESNHKADCIACGAELIYQGEQLKMTCLYCNQTYRSNVRCKNGHFICDNCHSLPAEKFIEQTCIAGTGINPLEMATTLMSDDRIKMHGPEHHFLVPAVLLSCYYNNTGEIDKKSHKIAEAGKRAAHVHGGFCGFYGSCGAAMGTGIFISLILDVNPLSVDGWRLANSMTSRSLAKISEFGGPRCCKRDSYLAIIEAVSFISENLNTKLDIDKDIKCKFIQFCRECLQDDCPFFA